MIINKDDLVYNTYGHYHFDLSDDIIEELKSDKIFVSEAAEYSITIGLNGNKPTNIEKID